MRTLLTLTAGACAVLLVAAPVGAGEQQDQQVADESVLTLADLPEGWEEDDTANEELPTGTRACRAIQRADDKAEDVPNAESPQFDDPNDPDAVASVSNEVFVYPKAKGAKQHLKPFKQDGEDCLVSLAENAGFADFTVNELDVEGTGDDGVGYSVALTAENGFVLNSDLVIVRLGRAVVTFNAENGEEPLPIGPDLLVAVLERLEEAL